MYVVPFHKYELHADSVVDDVVLFLIVKFKVTTESQPAAFVVVNVGVFVEAVYVTPLQV